MSQDDHTDHVAPSNHIHLTPDYVVSLMRAQHWLDHLASLILTHGASIEEIRGAARTIREARRIG